MNYELGRPLRARRSDVRRSSVEPLRGEVGEFQLKPQNPKTPKPYHPISSCLLPLASSQLAI
ncbi:MAG: hypothetical protein EWV55_15025 [Microcystis viridis Mv_BB_P_19951000_S69]|uniref:Uncharacterized protein n=1 Tax=Microcystis viridis Mv_BB_P_19951000_S68D TaxID=2486270 RepID=A0A552I7R4_MICVR|nr:MAG: hypothetical protein EWV47_21170 [Microcystis viridis Mv_BB_P_19951000_S68]TRU72346.1 MAG: hypothetical protein EWV55_15025 [Microcystis viridis Mv_BB_P_19951000_S69]TRU79514.1 MAG: hypothetical protein EWV77_02580 [Microcystis viridis Mv_BB_P_19951000_S68D]TRU90944.1 MAG: hypothetical protein EWV46_00545 [Microcystis viridis Mv_BB_P_19951000_S69D]